ncbi:hypothetical protein GCM10025876_20460 [Demequina litorisediminis]|uniref:Teichoic acids export ATP-binding protein TagH n=1 Tax=Demequina litorisediminis TaxID=1849022 RepID=A0ABQ6IGI0_9MICO|nr:hypothetical protein GCM10025876_20460 [Demequina litorisediminis]
MSSRLRFSIAVSRDHQILLVDEALAVGDKGFRQKSEARIRDMREQAGTVFLVSHSMTSILDTCNRVIWIDHGEPADGRRPRRGREGLQGFQVDTHSQPTVQVAVLCCAHGTHGLGGITLTTGERSGVRRGDGRRRSPLPARGRPPAR